MIIKIISEILRYSYLAVIIFMLYNVFLIFKHMNSINKETAKNNLNSENKQEPVYDSDLLRSRGWIILKCSAIILICMLVKNIIN
jgi:hypothetical protein